LISRLNAEDCVKEEKVSPTSEKFVPIGECDLALLHSLGSLISVYSFRNQVVKYGIDALGVFA
jgi:hypothetical protein